MGDLVLYDTSSRSCDKYIFARFHEPQGRKCNCIINICFCIDIEQDCSKRKNNIKKNFGKCIDYYWNINLYICIRCGRYMDV